MSRTTPNADRDGSPRQERWFEALGSGLEYVNTVEPLDGHGANDHLALIYESREERFATVVPFVRCGLEGGERCLCILDDEDEKRLLEALRDAGVDVDAALESGALTVRSEAETYRRDGGFDPDAMIGYLEDAIGTVREDDGYDRLRVTGGMTWALGDDTPSDALVEYEAKLDRLASDEDCVALCQYDRERFPAELLADVVRTHPNLIYDDTLCRNFYHVPPEEFLGPDRHEREVDRMMGTLLDRAEARVELREHERCLQAAYEITSESGRSFDGKVEALLELGRERFGLEVGCLTHLPTWDDEFGIEAVVGVGAETLDGPPSAQPRRGRYCRRTIRANGPVCETDVRELGWDDDPVFEAYGLRSYFGVRVSVGSEPYGTLWFGGTAPREAEFTDAERTFLELMAQWIGYELERREHNRYQRTLYEITANGDLSFDEKLRRLLEFGRDRFEVGIGFLARVEDDAFEVVDAVGSHEVLQPGATDDLDRTYCREVLESPAPICVVDAPAEGWEDDPAYETYDLDCYLGARVDVGDELYGTLCFADTHSRDRRFTEAETTFLELMTQWVSYELERERHEAQLAALNEMSRDLMDAGTPREVAERSVTHAEGALDFPSTAVLLYDEERGELSTAARTSRMADFPASAPSEPGSGALWEAFVANEPRVVDAGAGPAGDPVEAVAVPLGRQGLFVTATGDDGFDPAERDFVEATARTIETACARADRERLLREREETLAEQNEALERLNRINDIIRDIDRALVRASTRGEIESVVCERLAGAGPYELAWIGDHDAITGEVTPLEWAGVERRYLDGVTVDVEEGSDANGPIGRAVRTREPQIVNDVLDGRSAEPWRTAALDRGHHSIIALPLVYDDTLYGVLSVFAGQPSVFDELERTVLAELSDTIAYALNAAESKKALVSDEMTELELSIPRSELRSTTLSEEQELSLVKVVPRSGGGFHGFFTLRGGSWSDGALASTLPIADPTLVSEYEDDETGEPVRLFEGELIDGSVPRTVLKHGGRPRAFTVTDEATMVVDLAVGADVREFVGMIRTKYPGSELVAQRTRERPRRTSAELRATLADELTDRQLEALQIAYFAGYFDQPRARTSREIAETMGITQPTFNAHLRTAHRKLCHLLFDLDASEG